MNPVFIIGPPRTGTTLLKDLLAAHPQLTVHGEDFHPFHHDLTRFGERTERRDHFRLTAAEATPELAGEYRAAIASACERGGCEHFVLKISTLSLQIDYLKAMFPDARFLQLVRDGRDVACSMEDLRRVLSRPGGQRLLGPAPDPLGLWCAERFANGHLRAAACWAYHIAHSFLDLRFAGPESYRRYRYEDLVAAPKPILDEIQNFVGVAPAHEVEALLAQVSDQPRGKGGGLGFSTCQAPGSRRVGRYQDQMSAAERVVISPLLELPMRLFGYEPDPWPEVEAFFSACHALGIDPEVWRDKAKAEASWFSLHQEAFEPIQMARTVGSLEPNHRPLLVDGATIGSRATLCDQGSTNEISWVQKQDRRHSFPDGEAWWRRTAPLLNGQRTVAELCADHGLSEGGVGILATLFDLGFVALA